MECEICGKKEAVCLAHLEGAKISCCAGCAHGGKILYYFSAESGKSEAPLPSGNIRTEDEIVEGYGKLIRSAREKAGLTVEQLGLKIAEKANYLEHVEKEKTLPSLALARKLEKLFKIRLVESTTIGPGRGIDYEKKELTLLDIARIEHKEDKKKK